MIYLASPYTDPSWFIREQRYLFALHATQKLMFEEGKFVFSPIVYCHELAKTIGTPVDFNFWKKFNMAMIRKADELAVLRIDGWDQSKGVKFERQFAEDLGKPISYV